jgi:two-component system CheB/CheR fusion protein
MPKRNRNNQHVSGESAELKNRLEETEETLRAIRQYMVDAFVVTRENGVKVVTLSEADFPYRMMVESMNEGAVTLIPDGTIFYCNPRFAQMMHQTPEKLIGVRFQDLLPAEQHANFNANLRDAGIEGLRGEFCLQSNKETCLPVQLSFYQLRAEDANGIAVIATDISERMQAEEKIRALASELTIAEQDERHRISQVLHDDLQQRLFAIRAHLSFLNESLQSDVVPQEVKVSIDQVQGWLAEAINMTRNLSVDISPSVLQGDGISEAVYWLSARMKEQYGLQLKVDVKDDLRHLPDHMRVTLFQAVREMLFNVVKHASTLEATITFEKLDGNGRITITDQGKGFDAKTILADPQASHGLMIVRDRLNLMGSTLKIESVPGNGTQAEIEFPIEDALL